MNRVEESLLLSGGLDDITASGEIRDEGREGNFTCLFFVGKISNVVGLLL